MSKKIKNIVFIIIGIIIGGSLSVIASNVINANQVGFSSSKTSKTNLQDALDELYEKAKEYNSIPNYVDSNLLILYDGFHKVMNGKWIDLSGNNNNGILNGAVYSSQKLSFNGISDYVSISEVNLENITVEIVFDINNSNDANANQNIISNIDGGGYSIYYHNGTKKIVGQAYLDDGYKGIFSINTLNFGQRYSATLTYDGSALKLYINGIYQNEIQNNSGITPPQNSTYLSLGVNPKGSSKVDGEFLNGNIYSVRVYDRALSQIEITNNYNIDKKRFEI